MNKTKELFYFVVGIIPFLFFIDYFINIPLSEDTGLYAYLSKIVAYGGTLHKDVIFTSNSPFIYLHGYIMDFFNLHQSLTFIRSIHFFYMIMLLFSVYLITRLLKFNGLISAVCVTTLGIYINFPNIGLDLGRNYINPATAFFLFSIFFLFGDTEVRKKYFLVGFFAFLSAITRETFLIYYLLIAAFILLYEKEIDKKKIYLWFVLGSSIPLLINVFTLTSYNTWEEYLKTMIGPAVDVRYKLSIFDKLIHTYNKLYGTFYLYYSWIFSSLLIIGVKNKPKIINFFLIFIPFAIFEISIINKTAIYTIIPLISALIILFFYTVNLLYLELKSESFFSIKKISSSHNRLISFITFFIALMILLIFKQPLNVFNQYQNYYNFTNTENAQGNPNLLLQITNTIPHKTVSTNSQFPFLFLSEVPYIQGYPYLFDIAASRNLRDDKLGKDAINALINNPPDIHIGKTTTSYLGYKSKLGSILNNNFIIILASYQNMPGVMPNYKSRISLSKNNFKKHFESAQIIKCSSNYKQECIYNNATLKSEIIRLTTTKKDCLEQVSITNTNISQTYDKVSQSESEIYSVVLPNSKSNINFSGMNCNEVNIEVFKQKKHIINE